MASQSNIPPKKPNLPFAHQFAHMPPDYRIVQLAGPPEALAQAQAALLRPVASPFRRSSNEHDLDFLRACAAMLRSVHRPLWEEVCAFADAYDLPAERGLFVRAGALPHGCSSFAWCLPSGQMIAGRNYDFYERMPTRHLLITTPQHGYAHIGMNGGLVGGRYDGVNAHGVFVAIHKVMANRPAHTPPGVPFHLLTRLALELCANAEQAAGLISGLPHISSFNYTIADGQGTMFVLECYPGERVRVRRERVSLAVANHYASPVLAPLQGRRKLDGSRARVAALRPLPPIECDAWLAAQARCADHTAAVCAHQEFGTTLWSGVFDLSARRVAYAFGSPCRTNYQPLPWPGTSHGCSTE